MNRYAWRARPARPAGIETPTAPQFARYQRTRPILQTQPRPRRKA